MYSAVIPKFMEQALLGVSLDVHWDGRQARDFTHVANVVAANLLAARAPRAVGAAINVANGETYSLLDMIRVFEKMMGHKLARRHHPMRAGDVRKTWADNTKARHLLGYKPVFGFEDGLRDTWEFFQREYKSRAQAL